MVVVVVVVTVMVVVIFCLLNHYRASTRSFIHRPGQGQRQEDRPQLVSVGWGWVSPGPRLGLGAQAQDGTGLSSYIHHNGMPSQGAMVSDASCVPACTVRRRLSGAGL